MVRAAGDETKLNPEQVNKTLFASQVIAR